MTSKEHILKEFSLFSLPGEGIGSWLTEKTDELVFERLAKIEEIPLSKAQLDQLLLLSLEGGVSRGFFNYYWNEIPPLHPYEVSRLPGFNASWIAEGSSQIVSLSHLKWGLYRLYTDALLFFGDVRNAYRSLRTKSASEVSEFFRSKRFDSEHIKTRGSALELRKIPKDERYLISEMACKSYGSTPTAASELQNLLKEAWLAHKSKGGGRATIRALMEEAVKGHTYSDRQPQFLFSAD
jgi:hypothetical protein